MPEYLFNLQIQKAALFQGRPLFFFEPEGKPMSKREKISRTEPGSGYMDIETPIVSYLKRNDVDIDKFLKNIRSGMFDNYKRNDIFEVRDGIEITGRISWRRKTRAWSLDVGHLYIDNRIRYWSNVKRDVTQISIENIELPETVLMRLKDRPLAEVLEHPDFTDPNIMILDIRGFPAIRKTTFMDAKGPSLQIYASVPKMRFDDPAPYENVDH